MKKAIDKAVVAVLLLSAIVGLFTGCSLRHHAADGPGMVNYNGILLDALIGDWQESSNGGYRITFWSDYTFSLSNHDELLLVNADLALQHASTNTDEYSEFDVDPNVYFDKAGGSVTITKASHENGAVTLELTASDGTMTVLTFCRVSDAPELLDGPEMYHYGRVLDEAIAGCWYSADGRLALDFDGKCADFTVDGALLASKNNGYFAEHSFSGEADLDERCELYPTGNYTDDTGEPPLTITEMWYQSEHIYMTVIWSGGNEEEIVFSRAVDKG